MSARPHGRKLQFESLNPRLTMAGDLAPSFVDAPNVAAAAETIRVTNVVENLQSQASGKYDIAYKLSADKFIDASDRTLGTVSGLTSIAGQSRSRWTQSLALPASLPTGTYWFAIVVNPQKTLAEASYANNIVVDPTPITIVNRGVVTPKATANNATIDSLDVANNWLYSTDGKPHCNEFANRATRALGASNAFPLRWDYTGSWINVNRAADWMVERGPAYGWYSSANGKEAQDLANAGLTVVAVWKNPNASEHGHVAVLRGSANAYDASKGPQIAQAGRVNYNSTTVSIGFDVGGRGPASINDVKYYYYWS